MTFSRKRMEPVRTDDKTSCIQPIFKTVDQMCRVCGIGENRLRDMIDHNEIDYVSIGNRRLLTEDAVWDWYERNKIRAREDRHMRRSNNGNLRKKYSEQEK